ncbi:MAG TPA: leucine-rich repeat-containing protein kinase family protein [Ideonella sp.]|nr:leucine-rich repeat-containing protein kinase family protein [Ideonella sp.]
MHTLAQLRAGELAGLRRLDLCGGLAEFPPEIFDLADSLEILNLSGNALHSLPPGLHRLHRLRVLFCSDNRFTELPEAVGRCEQLEVVGFKANRIEAVAAAALPPRLRWLILTDNALAGLPDELGRRPRLQKLMLAGNRLAALPETLAGCERLELLRIAANRFEALPGWLPALPRLSWLAYADNPLCAGSARAPGTGVIDWARLSLQSPPLGEGASGVIHPALWQAAEGAAVPVAVKLFKGAVTSDGSPASEMAACIAAGPHRHLVSALGQLGGHPQGTPGLVMDRIAAVFRNLAGPPSLDSCTRDVYAAEARFTPQAAVRLALGIASATAHLHARGILHGDLYAHNILWDGQGEALLGDFGAASFLPVGDERAAQALQRLEVRAFGCLLEELLARCEAGGEGLVGLQALQRRCLHEPADGRPLFDEIEQALRGLAGAAS